MNGNAGDFETRSSSVAEGSRGAVCLNFSVVKYLSNVTRRAVSRQQLSILFYHVGLVSAIGLR